MIETALQILSQEKLAYITRSDYLLTILQTLNERSCRLSELHSRVTHTPSKSTIRRIIGDLQEFGWVQEVGYNQQITTTGQEVLNIYEELSLAVQQLIGKASWLQRLPPEDATFPIRELADAKLIVSNPSSPRSVLSTVFNLYDPDISRFRAFCSIYDSVLFKMYRGAYELFDFDVKTEVIFDWPTFVKITTTSESRFILDFLEIDDYDIYALKRPHTLGIGIYDERRVAIGAYNRTGDGNHIAMIISSNERLVEWGIDLYESYREQAIHATDVDIMW